MAEANRRPWFSTLSILYVLYALAFIVKSSVQVDGRRYFLLVDDAMISMTYAKNLAHGLGAVWYPGCDPVQGYSNPLWMLYMAAVHLLPLPSNLICLPIQLSGLGLIVGTLFFVKRIAERLSAGTARTAQMKGPLTFSRSELSAFFAVLLTAFYYPLNEWTLRGMEVGLLAFGITLAVWGALAMEENAKHERWLFPLLGLLTTVRMDAVVPGVVIVTWLAWSFPERRRRTLTLGMGCILLFLFVQMLVQKGYYHDWLPNTYYLKISGIPLVRRVVWGAYVSYCFLAGLGFWLLVLIVLHMVVHRSKQVLLLAGMVAVQIAYSVYIGGDSWEWWGGANRYLCVVMPLLFVLIGLGLATFSRALAAASDWISPRIATAVMVSLGLLTLLQINSYQFTTSNSLMQCLLIEKPHELNDHESMLRAALAIKRWTTPDAKVAVFWAGILPYYMERTPVDLLGKNDRKIASGPHKPIDPPPLDFFDVAPVPYCWPGHTKHDYRYSLTEWSPDIVQSWNGLEEIEDILKEHYSPLLVDGSQFFVKNGSTAVQIAEWPSQTSGVAK